VNNAVKFTEQGEIIVTVKVLEDDQNELLLYFSVSDTGIGLSDETKNKLFQSFQQADTSTSRKYGGSGLGLSISKQLVELMNGEVGVESELGKGSLFWFTAKLKKSLKNASSITTTNNLTGRRVLIIDDTESARDILENALSNIGLSVTQVSNGKHALKYIKQAEKNGVPYEIVFLDWYMPDMDGAETAKAIRHLSLTHPPQITIITAHGREEILSEMNNIGLDNILIKPINTSLLFDLVIRLLGESNASFEDVEEDVNDYLGFSYVVEDLKIIHGSSILVVEDNKLNQEVALGLLIDEGFKVDIANDGREAIDMVHQNDYDIVLMDMQMPVMNGVEATLEIRKNAKFDSLPIVAMTANAMLQDREKCLQAGMNDFISKPIDPEELFRTLLQWIRPKLQELPSTIDTQKSQLNAHTIESLPLIDGLNVSLGLKRVLGKTTLYFNLLRHYVSNQEKIPQEIEVALDTGDIETAERLAHTAKNVNGNIGASELENLAGEIEHLLRENTSLEVIGPKIDHFKNKQQSLIADLRAAISTIKKSEPIKDGEQSTEVIIEQLKDFLLDDDSAALTYFEENSALISRSFSIKVFSKIEIAIKQFDFEKALQLLANS
jgi:two-component system sensor histidine kinase/response regulator